MERKCAIIADNVWIDRYDLMMMNEYFHLLVLDSRSIGNGNIQKAEYKNG